MHNSDFDILIFQIESSDIHASISATGSVTFLDPPPQFTKADVDAVVLSTQLQTDLLTKLEADISKSKDYLSKIVKSSGGDPSSTWAAVQEEELLLGSAGMGVARTFRALVKFSVDVQARRNMG